MPDRVPEASCCVLYKMDKGPFWKCTKRSFWGSEGSGPGWRVIEGLVDNVVRTSYLNDLG